MKIVGVSILRNEQDVVESFVRHNLHVLDGLYVILHRSRDASFGILRALVAEGLALRLFEDTDHAFRQAERINSLARRAIRESNADYVVALDADEFLMADDRAHLERELATLLPGEAGLLTSQTYVPTPGDRQDEPCVVRRVTHRFDTGPRSPQSYTLELCKAAVGRWFADAADAHIFEGNHVVVRGGKPVPHRLLGIDLAHYPVRSLEQLQRKVVLGWVGYLAAHGDPKAKGLGAHWSRLYEELKVKGMPSWEDVGEFAALYLPVAERGRPVVHSPAQWLGGELRHSARQHEQPVLGLILDEIEGMARALQHTPTAAASRSAESSPGPRGPTPPAPSK